MIVTVASNYTYEMQRIILCTFLKRGFLGGGVLFLLVVGGGVLFVFLCLFVCFALFWTLHTQRGAQTHNPDIKSPTLL